MNESIDPRIRAHLNGERPLDEAGWHEVLAAVAQRLCTGQLEDPELVTALLEAEPERIDRCLPRADADRVLHFLEGSVVTSPAPRKAQIRAALLDRAAQLYGPPAGSSAQAGGRWLAVLERLVLVAAGAAAGYLVAILPGGPGQIAVPPPAPRVQDHLVQVAMRFPGYSPEFYPGAPPHIPKGVDPLRVADTGPLRAALWLDRMDGTYSEGDAMTIAYQVSRPGYVHLVEMTTTGTVQVHALAPPAAGPLAPGQVHTRGGGFDGPPGSEDLMLVATTEPLPPSAWKTLIEGVGDPPRAGPGGGRVTWLDSLRERVRAWATHGRVDIALARAHAVVLPRRR